MQCVSATVEFAVKRIRSEILPTYPNVDDVIAITHPYGCGIAIDAPGSEIPIRTLRNLSLNPNLGGAPMVVSLGCEKLQPAQMLPASSLPILSAVPYVIRLQDEQHRSFGDMVTAIMEMAEKRLSQLQCAAPDVPRPAADLVVGLQCGGSDAFSGVTANPAVGYAADLLVRAGATVMFSEVTEVRDAIHLLTARAANQEVARDLIREMAWYDAYLAARRRRPQREPDSRKQERRPDEYRREGAGLGCEGGQQRRWPAFSVLASALPPRGSSLRPLRRATLSAERCSWPQR